LRPAAVAVPGGSQDEKMRVGQQPVRILVSVVERGYGWLGHTDSGCQETLWIYHIFRIFINATSALISDGNRLFFKKIAFVV
jgi:hypothetical protein